MRTLTIDGDTWTVGLSGRVTQYSRDEVSIVFTLGSGDTRVRRVMRFSPLGSRSPETALQELPDARLREYFERSQPAWSAPETGYGR